MNISTTKKGGAYSAPTSMSVPSLKRNVILLSACTVAVSNSVSHIEISRNIDWSCCIENPLIHSETTPIAMKLL